jgi:hypothetical protein
MVATEPRCDYLSYLRLEQIGIEPQIAQRAQISEHLRDMAVVERRDDLIHGLGSATI